MITHRNTSLGRFSIASLLAIGLFILVGGYVASRLELSGAIAISGRLEGPSRSHAVQHVDGGTITRLFVQEGQAVRAGDPLLQLDQADISNALALIDSQAFDIRAQLDRLEAVQKGLPFLSFSQTAHSPAERAALQAQQNLFDNQLDSLRQQVELLSLEREQIKGHQAQLAAQLAALQQQLVLVEQDRAIQDRLKQRGLGLATTLRALDREAARLRGEIAGIEAMQAQASSRLTHTEVEILHLTTAQRDKAIRDMRDLQFRETELQTRRRQLAHQLDQRRLVAPMSGTVHRLSHARAGEVVGPAETIMTIIRTRQTMIMVGRLPARSIDAVHVGQKARLQFLSQPEENSAPIMGVLSQIAADTVTDGDNMPPYYRVEITVISDPDAPVEQTQVQGMPVEAYIKTTDRTLMAYLLDPLSRFFSRAMPEG